MNPEHVKEYDSIKEDSIINFTNELKFKYKEKIPSLDTLNGLAKVIAAYIRGIYNVKEQGPKHQMMFVNKNPLQEIIANAVGGKTDMYKDLRDTCVDIIISKKSGGYYYWEGGELSVEDWGKTMKSDNIDLVALYDARYRSAQIGNLSDLNDLESIHPFFTKAPVIEYRDLGQKAPSEMADIFRSLKEKFDS